MPTVEICPTDVVALAAQLTAVGEELRAVGPQLAADPAAAGDAGLAAALAHFAASWRHGLDEVSASAAEAADRLRAAALAYRELDSRLAGGP